MEIIYRISSDTAFVNSKEVIVIESNAPSSDIPYFVLIQNENGKLIVKNEFVARNEELELQRVTDYISLRIGEKTGRIYEFETFSNLKRDDVLNSINLYIKRKFLPDDKKFNNASLSYLILRKTFLKLKKDE
jgi:hypothetical protein